MISYIIPTRDRPAELAWTLEAIACLGDHRPVGGAEVLVVDNESRCPVRVGPILPSGVPVRVHRPGGNHPAGARNAAVEHADPRSSWLVMLDDDSHPTSRSFFEALLDAPPDVVALAADIRLPADRYEHGGLPEVFIGCGVAIRREAFLRAGGYDASFDYYAEEYDLAARLLHAGGRVAFEPRFQVLHRKVDAGRDFDRIIARLTRNNAWIMQRYAPPPERHAQIENVLARYREIAQREGALPGYERGLAEWHATRDAQPSCPLAPDHWDRFTGLAAARTALAAAHDLRPLASVALACPGKHASCVERALRELAARDSAGVHVVADPHAADTLVIATLSPGPMRDAWAACRRQFPSHRIVLPDLSVPIPADTGHAPPALIPSAALPR